MRLLVVVVAVELLLLLLAIGRIRTDLLVLCYGRGVATAAAADVGRCCGLINHGDAVHVLVGRRSLKSRSRAVSSLQPVK